MKIWVLAVMMSAVLWGTIKVIGKHLMKDVSSLQFTASFSFLATAFYAPVFVFFLLRRELVVTRIAGVALLVSGVANIAGWYVYNLALKQDEISVVAPFAKLGPLFTALLGVWVLGEQLTGLKWMGVAVVTAGSYIVLSDSDETWKHPFRQFFDRSGPKIAALSALILSIAAVADRTATQVIDPVFFTFFIYTMMSTGYIGAIIRSDTETLAAVESSVRNRPLHYLYIGLAAATASYLIFYSFSRAAASAVVPVLQFELLIPVIAGFLFFGETNMRRKIAGSVLIMAGIAMVAA